MKAKHENDDAFRDFFNAGTLRRVWRYIHQKAQEQIQIEYTQTMQPRHNDKFYNVIDWMDESQMLSVDDSQQRHSVYVEYAARRVGHSHYIGERLLEKMKEKGIKKKELNVKYIKIYRELWRARAGPLPFPDDEFATAREYLNIEDFDIDAFTGYLREAKLLDAEQVDLFLGSHGLCGRDADICLYSLLKKQKRYPVRGIALATCCHDKCDMQTYCNLDFLRQHFDDEQIKILPKIMGWAYDAVTADLGKERETLANMARRIYDYGRVLFIKEQYKEQPNFKVGAFMYCDPIAHGADSILLVAYDQSRQKPTRRVRRPEAPPPLEELQKRRERTKAIEKACQAAIERRDKAEAVIFNENYSRLSSSCFSSEEGDAEKRDEEPNYFRTGQRITRPEGDTEHRAVRIFATAAEEDSDDGAAERFQYQSERKDRKPADIFNFRPRKHPAEKDTEPKRSLA